MTIDDGDDDDSDDDDDGVITRSTPTWSYCRRGTTNEAVAMEGLVKGVPPWKQMVAMAKVDKYDKITSNDSFRMILTSLL